MRILRHISLLLLLSNAGTLPARADSASDIKDCSQNTDAAAIMRGCSAIIDHPQTQTPEMRVIAYLNRGHAYYAKDENDRAIADYNQALRLDQRNAVAYNGRGNAYDAKGEADRAIADYDQAIRLDPKSAVAYSNRGDTYHTRKENDRAIADYDQAIRLDPKYAVAYVYRGNAYYAKDENDRAIADYNQAIRLDPGNAAAYNGRGNAYDSKGEPDRAIADYDQAIRLDPKDAVAYNSRGNAYSEKGEKDRAIADYDQAIRLDPKAAVFYICRGTAYMFKGEYDRAIADYDQAIRLDPKAAFAFIGRGTAYMFKGEFDLGIADYDQAIRLDPKYVEAYMNRGIAYQANGDNNRAVDDFEQASRIDPTSKWGLFGHGAALFLKGDIDRAIADFDAVIRLDARFSSSWRARGLAHSAKGEYVQAVADFDQALSILAINPLALGGRAVAFEKLGDYSRARADLFKVLAIWPNDQKAKDALTRLAQIERGRATAQGSSASETPSAPVQKPATLAPSYANFSRRVALVIGNGAYQSVPALPNPSNDAKAMAEMFRAAGFDSVDVAANLGVKEMRHALRDFADKAAAADAAVVYFAGHGVEIGGRDYLIPTDAVLRTDIDVEDEAVELDRVLQLLEPVKRLKLVILDACRDNPFRKSMRRTAASRSIGRGLAAPDLQTGDTLIAFAAKAGSEAADGTGVNSPFTSALLRNLTIPGLDIRIALGQVHDDVLRATGRNQEPYIYGALGGGTLALAPGN